MTLSREQLQTWLCSFLDPSYPLHTRVHPLKSFPPEARWFVKREDELSFGISGSKYRKYAALMPYIQKQGYDTLHLVGSSYSNHLVGFLQLVHEYSLKPVVYLLGSPNEPLRGNYAWIRLLLGPHPLHFLSHKEWPERDRIIQKHLTPSSLYLPEGAECFPALLGALSLAPDIVLNQEKVGVVFDHIIVDAGTGLTAIALLLGLACMGLSPEVHIILMAHTPIDFEHRLQQYHARLEHELGTSLTLPSYHLYPSALAKSFGATSRAVFEEVRTLACQEGLLCDPIYNAKLFYTARWIHKTYTLKGSILCIHSGGALSLSGFPKLFSEKTLQPELKL